MQNFEQRKNLSPFHPWRFVFLLGTLSLLADVTYEGGRSLTGPFLTALGASPLLISALSGGGELLGYLLRFFSGRFVDRTKRYWPVAYFGYALNLLAVPPLALCRTIVPASFLLVSERAGKGIRNPPRDAMLSYAAQKTGKPGTAFGIHDAMDKIGSLIGPLFVAALFYKSRDFSIGFGSLLIPAVLALGFLLFLSIRYSKPQEFIEPTPWKPIEKKHQAKYWYVVFAAGFLAAGTADFPFIARHFEKIYGISNVQIPILYSLAMASAAAFSFLLSRFFDRVGIWMLGIPLLLGGSAVLVIFLPTHFTAAVIGSMLWGGGFAAQEPIAKAFISRIVHPDERGNAYGTFWSIYGLFWFFGSLGIGFLYMHSIASMIVFSIGLQLLALPFIRLASKAN